MGCGVSDVFGNFEKTLGKVNDGTVVVPAIDEVIHDFVLVFFTNVIVKNHDLLRLMAKFFKWNDFWRCFNDFVPCFWVNSFRKVPQEKLVFILVEVFLRKAKFHQRKVSCKSCAKACWFCHFLMDRQLQVERSPPAWKGESFCALWLVWADQNLLSSF